MALAELAPPSAPVAIPSESQPRWPRITTLATMFGLYVLAATLLLLRIGEHPAFIYNWEAYTARAVLAFWDHPSAAIFGSTEGLMTDSGFSPFVALPAWLAFRLAGVGLTPFRVVTALQAAGAVPLLWLVGRRFVGTTTALFAALLMALSPVFLLYGRTATFVCLSLVPALATAAALLHVLQRPTDRRWLIALQATLIVGIYFYAPIRFLWPLSVLLLAVELAWRPELAAAWQRALLVTVLVLPVALMLAAPQDRLLAIPFYFEGRSEQVLGLSVEPDFYGAYIHLTDAEIAAGGPTGNRLTLALRLVAQNTADYTWLLLDQHTKPALTDYWNSQGRLYPVFLVPFFVLGLLRAARRARRRVEDRLLLALFFGFGLPLLLTSRVHIGRLIFVLPILCLLVADGVFGLTAWLAAQASHGRANVTIWRTTLAGLAAVVLLGAVGSATWSDYHISPAPPPEAGIATMLLTDRPLLEAHGGGVLVFDGVNRDDPIELDIERARVGANHLLLDQHYRFINLVTGEQSRTAPGDTRIPIYYGGIFDGLRKGEIPDSLCDAVFYVEPRLQQQFAAALNVYDSPCVQNVRLLPLP